MLGGVLFTSCGDKDDANATAKKTCKEITATIMSAEISFPEMVEVNEENFRMRYALAEGDYKEYSVYWAGDGSEADEICVILCDTDAQFEKAKKAVETRRESQITTYQDYAPLQADRLKESKVTTKGKMIFWSVCDDNDVALTQFNGAFE